MSKQFSLIKRNKYYYARFKRPDGGWTTAQTTKQTSKYAAENWCLEYLKKGNVIVRGNVTLRQFSQGFFDWSGPWATDKKITGKRISQRHCKDRTELLNNHILPHIGDKKLADISKSEIKQFRNKLFHDGFSGNTINKALSALKTILEHAEDQSLIQYVPKIERAADNPKQKGILTIDEVNRLFSAPWVTDEYFGHPVKANIMAYVGNKLAASTGLRIGEIQALTLQDIHLDENYITVWRSWDTRLNQFNTTTKTGRARNIFIPESIKQDIVKLMDTNPAPDDPNSLLFYSQKTPGKPAEQKFFSKALHIALKNIGIDEQQRKERNITFHSWRHFLNSILINAKIPLIKVQALTGHSTTAMSAHYFHLDDMQDIIQLQESLFKTVK